MPIEFTYQPPKIDVAALVSARVKAAEIAGAEALLKASEPLVPVDKGVLKASGHVEHSIDGAAVVYTAVNPADEYDYAAIQHEREDFHHDQGQAHYLSDPMRTEQAAIVAAMAVEIRF
jgi:hypothetical protein